MVEKFTSLSYPEISEEDVICINQSIKEINMGLISTIIPEFENKLCLYNKVKFSVALSSGTSAIHLALLALKIGPGDRVIIPTLTFAGSAFPVKYLGASPVFLDVNPDNLTIDLDLLEKYLKSCKVNNLPKLILSVDLFGKCCDYDRLFELANHFEIPVLIDAAESLGSLYKETPSASLGAISILSFNSNKLVTTTGGGAILTNNEQLASTIRKLSNQARENFHWYEHSEIGYNYRLSPILAALGMSQLSRIDKIVEKRRKIRQTYKDNLELLEGIQVSTDSSWEKSNAWLTTIKIRKKNYANGRDLIYESLAKSKIEARFIWKPLHMQPVFSNSDCIINGISESAFYTSLCLPSSQDLSYDKLLEICDIVKDSLTGK